MSRYPLTVANTGSENDVSALLSYMQNTCNTVNPTIECNKRQNERESNVQGQSNIVYAIVKIYTITLRKNNRMESVEIMCINCLHECGYPNVKVSTRSG